MYLNNKHARTDKYSAVQKVWDQYVFFKEVSYAHQSCIYLIKNIETNFILSNIIAI